MQLTKWQQDNNFSSVTYYDVKEIPKLSNMQLLENFLRTQPNNTPCVSVKFTIMLLSTKVETCRFINLRQQLKRKNGCLVQANKKTRSKVNTTVNFIWAIFTIIIMITKPAIWDTAMAPSASKLFRIANSLCTYT